MPAAVWYRVDKPHVPLVPHGRYKCFVIVAAASCAVDTLYFPLSGYFISILVSRAPPGAVTRRCCGSDRLRNGGSVIKIFL